MIPTPEFYCDECDHVECIQMQSDIIEVYIEDLMVAIMKGDINTCYFKLNHKNNE